VKLRSFDNTQYNMLVSDYEPIIFFLRKALEFQAILIKTILRFASKMG